MFQPLSNIRLLAFVSLLLLVGALASFVPTVTLALDDDSNAATQQTLTSFSDSDSTVPSYLAWTPKMVNMDIYAEDRSSCPTPASEQVLRCKDAAFFWPENIVDNKVKLGAPFRCSNNCALCPSYSRCGNTDARYPHPHNGTDIYSSRAPGKTHVFATAGGKVTLSEKEKIEIRHSNRVTSYYTHLKERKVEKDAYVYAGQHIGMEGNVGAEGTQLCTQNSHLHFEIRKDGVSSDPTPYFGPLSTPKSLDYTSSGWAGPSRQSISCEDTLEALPTDRSKAPAGLNLIMGGTFNSDLGLWTFVRGKETGAIEGGKLRVQGEGSSVFQDLYYRFVPEQRFQLSFSVKTKVNGDVPRSLDVVIHQEGSQHLFYRVQVPHTFADQERTVMIWARPGFPASTQSDWKPFRIEFYVQDNLADYWYIDNIELRVLDTVEANRFQGSLGYLNGTDFNFTHMFFNPFRNVDATAPNEPVFPDISPVSPHFEAVQELGKRLISTGYSDGTFRPDSHITRGEITKFITRGMGHSVHDENGNSIFRNDWVPFSDLNLESKQKFGPYIRYLSNHNHDPDRKLIQASLSLGDDRIVSGYGDGTFKPGNPITREELATLIFRAREALNIKNCNKNDSSPDSFEDIDKDSIHKVAIDTLAECGIVNGYPDGTFKPKQEITRAEAAAILYRGLVQPTQSRCINDYICENQRNMQIGSTNQHQVSSAALQSVQAGERFVFTVRDQGPNANLRMEVYNGNAILASAEGRAAEGTFSLTWVAQQSDNYFLRLTNTNPFAWEGIQYRLLINNVAQDQGSDIRWTYSVSPRENDSQTCGQDNWIKLWARPNSANQSTVTLRMRKCDDSNFVSGGSYWVESTDGAYKSNEYRLTAGQNSVSVDIDPYGEKGISPGKNYRMRLRSDNDQQGTPKQTGTVNITPRLQLRTTVTARMNGTVLNDIGIWNTRPNGPPQAYGQIVDYYENTEPKRFFMAEKPGYYVISSHEPSAYPDERDPFYVFYVRAGEDAVVEFIEDCYELNAFARPLVGGRIHLSANPTCDTPGYRYGEQVTLTAEPALGYRFVRWRGSATGSASSVTVTMNEYRSAVADFEEVCYSLNTSFDESQGRIDIQTPANCEDGQTFLAGTTVYLLATPKDGYEFVRWQNSSNPSRATSLTIDSDKSITAVFQPATPTAPLGDVSCDSDANVTDASWILQYDVGLRRAADSCPLQPDTILLDACDVNGDGACDVRDALWLLQCSVGLSNSFCPASAALAAPPAAPTTTPARLYLDHSAGQTMIMADLQGNTLGAATIELHYDSAHHTITGCTSDPGHRFNLALCNPTYSGGVARFNVVTGSGVTGVLPLAQVAIEPADTEASLQLRVVTFAGVNGAPIVTEGEDSAINIRLLLPFVQR